MKKLTFGMTALLATATSVMAHGNHGVTVDSAAHAPHGLSTLMLVTSVGAAGIVLAKILLSRGR
jgi:hypothetical protein